MPAATDLALDLRSYPGEVQAHDHPHHQVILALEGGLDMEIGLRSGRVDSTQGALVPAGTRHAFAGIGRNRFVTLDIAAGAPPEPDRRRSGEGPFFAVPRAVEHLLAYVDARRADFGADANHLAPLFAAALSGPRSDTAMPDRMLRAIRFLRRACHRPLGCADVARAAGISTSHLHGLFKQWTGMGPARYLAELRLGHARDRLAGGAEPIAEIALGAGFSEQSAFTRAFRRRFGESPAAYRRRLEQRHKPQ